MPTNLENWTSVMAGCAISVARQLDSWIGLSHPPDLFEYLTRTIQQGPSEQADFLVEGHVISRTLLDPDALSVEQAKVLMGLTMAQDSSYDTKLLQRLLSGRAWPAEVPVAEVQRCLELVEDTPDPNRISVTLLKFARHPDVRVQAQAAKILGRYMQNVSKIEELYLNPNERVRANLIEGIARRVDPEILMPLVEQAAKEPSSRVSTMALAILARRGHKMSQTLLAMRRRSKEDSISWAANFAHEAFVRPFQTGDLGALATALARSNSGDSPQPAVMSAVAKVDGQAESHPDEES